MIAIAQPWRGSVPLACLFLTVGLGVTSLARAVDDAPLVNPSAAQLRDALSPATTAMRSFHRTEPPSTEGLCAADADQASAHGGKASRNLVAVPFAGESAPHVNLAVYFVNDSDALTQEGRAVLTRVAGVLDEPGMLKAHFALAGHTDAVGDAQRNLELSCARAISARRFLVSKGVAPQRISAYGFGSSRRIEETDGPSALNRRVEVRRAD